MNADLLPHVGFDYRCKLFLIHPSTAQRHLHLLEDNATRRFMAVLNQFESIHPSGFLLDPPRRKPGCSSLSMSFINLEGHKTIRQLAA